VDDAKVRRRRMRWCVGPGGARYQFINIDDGWEGTRDANGVLQPNQKFPNMKAAHRLRPQQGPQDRHLLVPRCAHVSRACRQSRIRSDRREDVGGLGIRSPQARLVLVRQHDPKQAIADLQKPYSSCATRWRKCRATSSTASASTGWAKCGSGARNVGGNLWRTTGDLTDVWSNMAAVGSGRTTRSNGRSPGTGPIPTCSSSASRLGPEHPRHALTPNEQITHISLWALQAAPLLHRRGHDAVRQIHTTDLMTNHEVLDVNQDSLGKAARRRVSARTT
jgi:alpha-galactosidase